MQKSMHRTSAGARLLSLILAVVLALGFVPIAPRTALATGETTPDVSQLAAVTDETFTASADGKEMTKVVKKEGGYSYTSSVYDPENPEADDWGYVYVPTPANLYVVTVPAETAEVDLDFNGNQTWVYNYTAAGEYLSGYYTDYGTGPTSATVSVDFNGDGAFDVIQVQNPYAEDYSGGEIRFAVTFACEEPELEPSPEPEPAGPDSMTLSEALKGLSDRFVSGGADGAITNDTWAAAIALNNLDLGGKLDVDAVKKAFLADDAMSAGRMGKYVMILTAAGADCAKVELDGEIRDLIAEMEKATDFDAAYFVYSAVTILPVFQYGGYTATDDQFVDRLVSYVVNNMAGLDNQTLAQAVLALSPYQESADVASALAEAKETLVAAQQSDGGFVNGSWSTGSDPDTSAWAVAALASQGVDVSKLTASDADMSAPASDEEAASPAKKTAADYLAGVCYADEDGVVYVNYGEAKSTMAAADVILGLAAVSGQQSGDPSYNVYKAKKITPVAPEDPEKKDDEGNSDATNGGGASATAKTGDVATPLVLVIAALGATVVLFALRRRGEN